MGGSGAWDSGVRYVSQYRDMYLTPLSHRLSSTFYFPSGISPS